MLTITVADGSHEQTITVDTSGPQPTIREAAVRPLNGGGIIPAELATVDLDKLVSAFSAAATGTARIELPPAPTDKPMKATRPKAVKTAPAVPQKAAAPAVKKKTTKAAPAEPDNGTARPYRRMPDDFGAVVEKVGAKPKALVAHYGDVPVHTISGWLRKLRKDDVRGSRRSPAELPTPRDGDDEK